MNQAESNAKHAVCREIPESDHSFVASLPITIPTTKHSSAKLTMSSPESMLSSSFTSTPSTALSVSSSWTNPSCLGTPIKLERGRRGSASRFETLFSAR